MRMSVLGYRGLSKALCQLLATRFSFWFVSKKKKKNEMKWKKKWKKKKNRKKLENENNKDKRTKKK